MVLPFHLICPSTIKGLNRNQTAKVIMNGIACFMSLFCHLCEASSAGHLDVSGKLSHI